MPSRPALVVLSAVAIFCVLTQGSGGLSKRPLPIVRAAGELFVEVTNAGDGVLPTQSICPSPTLCTLRRAIELANADATSAPYNITFAPTVFKPGDPAVISILATELPAIVRNGVKLDASLAGVTLDGAALPTGVHNGLMVVGGDSAVRGLAIERFTGSCLVAAGANATIGGIIPSHRVTVGSCEIGLELRGLGSVATNLRVGFRGSGGEAALVSTGIVVSAADVQVGTESATSAPNVIGNANVGIRVGAPGATVFSGVLVANNTIGKNPAGAAAPVDVGVDLRQPSKGSIVRRNTISHAVTGIRIAADADSLGVVNNRLLSNRFEAITGLAIDLNGDGITNPNDVNDVDTGANGLRNHPVFQRAVQSRIAGNVGALCLGCAVELYLAAHVPGGTRDYGAQPVPVPVALTDATGNFVFENPPVAPGQWVIALVTDPEGNTSEFGPSTRVGAGVVQCGNAPLELGWNHSGFFGPSAMSLGPTFPPEQGSPSPVSAIYHLNDGTANYSAWLSATPAGRTLEGLAPGEAYWFFAEAKTVVTGGFSLSAPFPVQLKTGWNDFVYIGATADARDSLSSIAGKYNQFFRWEADSDGGHWLWYGDDATPSWARGFNLVEACGTYLVHLTQDATLTPLQP